MHLTRHLATTAALVVALGTSAGSAAARVDLSGSSGTCSEVCSGGAASYGTPVSNAPSDPGPCSEICSGGQASYGISSTNATSTAGSRPMIVRIVERPSGFDWGDAGIGVAGGVALSMLGLGGALAASQRRTRRAAALTR